MHRIASIAPTPRRAKLVSSKGFEDAVSTLHATKNIDTPNTRRPPKKSVLHENLTRPMGKCRRPIVSSTSHNQSESAVEALLSRSAVATGVCTGSARGHIGMRSGNSASAEREATPIRTFGTCETTLPSGFLMRLSSSEKGRTYPGEACKGALHRRSGTNG